MPVVVVVHREVLTGMGTQPAGAITRHWLRLLAGVDRRAKKKLSNDVLHVRTGNLRSSQQTPFILNPPGMILGVVQNIAGYALALHEGSQPHEIRPRTKRVLTGWSFNGAPVFTPVVHHPGTQARPWLRDSLIETMRADGGA